MKTEDKFVVISGLLCEPTRARMLWNLLDGRAYTATELAVAADISFSCASNHLSKMLKADLLKVEPQGRHRYFSFAKPEIAYAIEALASLVNDNSSESPAKIENTISGIKYCRTCYDHLAGFVGVKITEALEQKRFLQKSDKAYEVTVKGWNWFAKLDISHNDLTKTRRPITRQCLDWTERRPHLAGKLGAVLLEKMLTRKWFEKIEFCRELQVTSKGKREIFQLLDIAL